MTAYNVFDIILVPFPFTDLSTKKQRPALVLKKVNTKAFANLLICAMITSQTVGEKIEGDYLLRNWQGAGLLHLSKLRMAKLVTLESSVVIKRLGKLADEDSRPMRDVLSKFFNFK